MPQTTRVDYHILEDETNRSWWSIHSLLANSLGLSQPVSTERQRLSRIFAHQMYRSIFGDLLNVPRKDCKERFRENSFDWCVSSISCLKQINDNGKCYYYTLRNKWERVRGPRLCGKSAVEVREAIGRGGRQTYNSRQDSTHQLSRADVVPLKQVVRRDFFTSNKKRSIFHKD